MKLTKSQLKQIIQEELENVQEVEYDDVGNPLYADPVVGQATSDDAEVLVPGYGGMRIDQLKKRIAKDLMEASEAAAAGEFRRIGKSNLKMLALFLETLDDHQAI